MAIQDTELSWPHSSPVPQGHRLYKRSVILIKLILIASPMVDKYLAFSSRRQYIHFGT